MTRHQVTRAIEMYVKTWGISAEEINDGFCGSFSSMVVEYLGGETEELFESFTVETNRGHCWVTFQGRHYDAECPEGVGSKDELPFFKRLKV